jgi:general secretion pathway protein C
MLDKRAQEWLTRLQGNGPRLASLGLAALIAVELARIAIAFLGGGPVKSPQPEFGNIAPRAGQHAGFDIQSVVSAHLFGIATVDPSAQDPANAPPSTSNLVLAGTIATQNPKRGVAIISDGGPSKVYSVGDNVGGASLHSVYLDHVILDRGGALETLTLPRLMGPGMHARGPTRRGGADPRTAAAVENIRQLVQQDPNILDQVMRTVPSYDSAAGKLRGFRAYPGRNRQIFNKLGLKSGDLVTAINGTVLDDPQRSQEVFNTIQSSDHVTVDVERGGQKQQITLNIAQVAAQATKDLEADANPASAAGDTAAPGTTTAGAPAAGAPPNEAPPPPQPQPSAVPGNPNQNPNQ